MPYNEMHTKNIKTSIYRNRLIQMCVLIFVSASFCAQQINSSNLKLLLDKANKTNSEAIVIYHEGKLVCEKYFHAGKPGQLMETMSATKSVVGLALLKLLSDKKIDSLDVPVYKFFPEWNQGNKKMITLRMLMDHTSGLQNQLNSQIEIYPSPDFVKLALAAEVIDFPGSKFAYNNKAVNLISGIIQQVSGKRMDIYIKENIFTPLGITNYYWQLDSVGNAHGLAGCQIMPADLAKLGLLMLNKGLWNDVQLIDQSWITLSTQPSRLNPEYGLLWWLSYQQTSFSVTNKHLDIIKKSCLDTTFVRKVRALVGEYKSEVDYENAKVKIFGPRANEIIMQEVFNKGLNIRDKTFNNKFGFAARGFLGNYLVIIPEKNLVGVRMTSPESTNGEAQNYFKEFDLLLYSLVN